MAEGKAAADGCQEKERLSEEYQAALTAFSEAVLHLQERGGVSRKNHYENLRNQAEQGRSKSLQARQALEDHVMDHRC